MCIRDSCTGHDAAQQEQHHLGPVHAVHDGATNCGAGVAAASLRSKRATELNGTENGTKFLHWTELRYNRNNAVGAELSWLERYLDTLPSVRKSTTYKIFSGTLSNV